MKRKRIEVGRDGTTECEKYRMRKRQKERNINSGTPECRIIRII